MPENIGSHGLYCPDFDDYAAVALYMQDLGTRIDDALSAQLDELNDFLNAPTIILTNSVAVTIAISGEVTDVFDTEVFNNSTFMTFDAASDTVFLGSPAGTPSPAPYRRGAYSIGSGARMTATGAVTVGSQRYMQILVADPALATATDPFGTIIGPSDTTSDMNTGGNEGLLVESNFLLTNVNGVEVTWRFGSSNLASSTSIPAGSAFLWITYNGPTDIIEVA